MVDIIDGGGDGTLVLDGGTPATGELTEFDVYDGNVQIRIGDPSAVSLSQDSKTMSLESLDGSIVIPLNADVENILVGGATGLGLPPLDVVTAQTPGMPGSWLQEVNVLEREVFIPLEFASPGDQAAFFAKLATIRQIIWTNGVDIGSLGTFRLVCNSVLGERVLNVTYKSGWEGAWGGTDSGVDWEKVPLTLVAVDPFFRDRVPTKRIYSAAPGEAFIGTGDGTHPFPRRLSASVVIGNDMQVDVAGDVPVWPVITLQGPDSTASVTFPGAAIMIPNGIPDGGSLRLVTDPRARSARLQDDTIAWPIIDDSSTFAPLMPGTNLVNVLVGTAGPDTGLTLEYTNGYQTPW